VSDFNKVPFGLRVADNTIVDVCEVPNGNQCGCVCPSCHTPLKARQGDIKAWHFAHNSKKVYQQTKAICEYSFYTSVRLMARQVIGNQIQLSLPGLTGKIEYYQGIRWAMECKEFKVTDPTTVIIEHLDVDTTFSGASVDIVGTISDFQFVIYFTHPDRVVPESLCEPANPKCGILEISLHSLFSEFIRLRAHNKTYREILTDFLKDDRRSKKWVYHPRFEQKANEAMEDLKRIGNILECNAVPIKGARKVNPLAGILPDTPSFQVNRVVRFECIMCRTQWEGPEAGGNHCPKCQDYLYTKIIG
jgi:hypothetical protein